MPSLRYLELGYNNMRRLGGCEMQNAAIGPQTPMTRLESVNFDGNALEKWNDIMMAIIPFTTSIAFFHA